MDVVRTCAEFNQGWNERLDRREFPSHDRDQVLTDHAATCDSCRARDPVFADFEAFPTFPSLRIPAPSPEAMIRWEAAAEAGYRSRRTRPGLRRRVRVAARWGAPIGVAAALVLATLALMPASWPTEVATSTASRPALLFEEAFDEASTMTWELAREISAPADRLSTQALGTTVGASIPPFQPTQYNPVEVNANAAPYSPTAGDLREVELISNSSPHPFRLLGGHDEETQDSELAEGS